MADAEDYIPKEPEQAEALIPRKSRIARVIERITAPRREQQIIQQVQKKYYSLPEREKRASEKAQATYDKYKRFEKYKITGRRIGGMISKLAYKQQRAYTKGGASYQRQVLRGQSRANPKMIRAINVVSPYGVSVPQQATRGRSGGRPGRPRGTYDMRYAQFEGIYGYRKWIAQKRALERLQARGQGAPQQMPQQAPQMTYSEQSQMEQQMPTQPIQQQPQQVVQQPIWGPNFMKLSTGQGTPVKKVDALNPELPQGDKYGDYYTEPDFFSGKQVLRRRSGDRLFKW